jgi:ribonuclease R
VTNFGVFVELSDLYIEGLIHISALPGDYYHFDQAKQRLIGERTRQIFQLGGAVTVRVARVDLDDRKIDLELAGVAPSRRGKTSKRRSDDEPEAKTRAKKSSRRQTGSTVENKNSGRGRKSGKSSAEQSKSAKPPKSAKSKKASPSGRPAKASKAGKASAGKRRSGKKAPAGKKGR